MTSQTQEVKAIRQRNLTNKWNITSEIFFFKNHAENEARRIVPDRFVFKKNFIQGQNKWPAP